MTPVAVGATLALSGCGLLFPFPFVPAPEPEVPIEETVPAQQADGTEGLVSGDYRTGPIPASSPEFDESTLPAEPGDTATPTEQIEWEVLKSANQASLLYDPSSTAECTETQASVDETIDCTVTYQGLQIPYTVDVTGGSYIFSYEYRADSVPMVRDVVEDALRYWADAEAVRCDMDEAQLATPDIDSGVVCDAQTEYGVESYNVEVSAYGYVSFTMV